MATWCSPQLREQILTRDNYTCRNCGCDSLRILEIDHIVPTAKGGAVKDPDNLQVLCGPCNRIKANHTIRFEIRPKRTERIDYDTMELLMENKRLELERWASMMREEIKEKKAVNVREFILGELRDGKTNRQILRVLRTDYNIGFNRSYDMLNELKNELKNSL